MYRGHYQRSINVLNIHAPWMVTIFPLTPELSCWWISKLKIPSVVKICLQLHMQQDSSKTVTSLCSPAENCICSTVCSNTYSKTWITDFILPTLEVSCIHMQ